MRKKGNTVLAGLIICLLLVFLAAAGKLFGAYLKYQKGDVSYEKLQEYVQEPEEEESPESEKEKEEPKNRYLEIDFAGLKAVNPDVIAWIQIPALDISYPVVQGEDNDYYLKHSFEGESVNAGCIFMDCGASADWSDRNTFVFGHNMRDESMFGAFKNLLKGTASCEENPYFYIYTEDKVYIYEIFSYYETKSTSDRFATFTSDASYDDYVQWATEHSLYASDADLSDRGNIVSLSTCYGSSGTKRRALIH